MKYWDLMEREIKRVLRGRSEVLVYRRPSHSGWENDHHWSVLFLKMRCSSTWCPWRGSSACVSVWWVCVSVRVRRWVREWRNCSNSRVYPQFFFFLSTLQPRADVSDSCGKNVCTLHGLWDIFSILTFLNNTWLICSVPSKWLISTCPTLSHWFSVDGVNAGDRLNPSKRFKKYINLT